MNATEETGGPTQRTEVPLPAADLPARGPPRAELPSGGAGQTGTQRASAPANHPPDMAACGSDEGPDAGQPGTEPRGPMPDAGHAAGLPPPTAHGARPAGHAGAIPSTAPAYFGDAGALGNAASGEPPRGPPGTHAKSEAPATTPDMPKRAADKGTSPGGQNRDEDPIDAFMESRKSTLDTDPTRAAQRGHPEPGDNHTGGKPLTVSRQAHVQCNYAAPGTKTEQAAATENGPETATGAADQTPDEHSAPGSGTRVATGSITASEPADQPPRTTPSWGRGHLDYARSEGDARHPSAHAGQAAAQDLDLWIDRITTGEGLALAVSI